MQTVSLQQCKMARAGLDWTLSDLAKTANLSLGTVLRFERGDSTSSDTKRKITTALINAGVVFTEEGTVSVPPQTKDV